ncbi:MAG: toll/interleukin-1 receptor domain-containing protein [Terracidiphilus sp.]
MPPTLFFSYSHVDESLRNQLEVHLSALKRQDLIATWHDRRITAGSEVGDAIDANLNTAQVVLLLVSSDFIASDYCYEREMARAIERHERGDARIIPVILRPCDWHDLPFGKLLAAPRDGKPVSVATPEEVAGIRFRAGRQILEGLDHERRKRNIDRCSGFRLVEEEAVATEAMPFEGDGVADAQSAPAHQQRHSAEPCPIRIGIDESAAIVTDVVGGVDDAVEFFLREVVRGDLDNLDLAQSEGRVFLKIPAPHAGPEETDQSALLLLLCQSGISPGAAKVQKCVKVDFIEIGKPLRLRPGEKLLAEDCRQFGVRGRRDAAARCVGQVSLDGRLYSDPWLLRSVGT